MKKLAYVLFICLYSLAQVYAIPTDSLYLGRSNPGIIPVLFSLPETDGFFAGERLAISPEGSEIYYGELDGYGESISSNLFYYYYDNNHWNGPIKILEDFAAPSFSISGDTLYLQKFRSNSDRETYQIIRTETRWTEPVQILEELGFTHNFQVCNNGRMHVLTEPENSLGGWDRSILVESDQGYTAVGLGSPINTDGEDGDYYVAKDESYMIVNRYTNTWELFITFNKYDGSWTNPVSLGDDINFGVSNWGPHVTRDNKFLFFTAATAFSYATADIYWVQIDERMASLKDEVLPFRIENPIPDQRVLVGEDFSYFIPDSVFYHIGGTEAFTVELSMAGSDPFPEVLTYNEETRTISGNLASVEEYEIQVHATDTAGVELIDNFIIKAKLLSGRVNSVVGTNVLIYPNPVRSNVNIDLVSREYQSAIVRCYNAHGALVAAYSPEQERNITLDLSSEPTGVYLLTVQMDGVETFRKIFLQD